MYISLLWFHALVNQITQSFHAILCTRYFLSSLNNEEKKLIIIRSVWCESNGIDFPLCARGHMYVTLLAVTKDAMCCIGMQSQSHHCWAWFWVVVVSNGWYVNGGKQWSMRWWFVWSEPPKSKERKKLSTARIFVDVISISPITSFLFRSFVVFCFVIIIIITIVVIIRLYGGILSKRSKHCKKKCLTAVEIWKLFEVKRPTTTNHLTSKETNNKHSKKPSASKEKGQTNKVCWARLHFSNVD